MNVLVAILCTMIDAWVRDESIDSEVESFEVWTGVEKLDCVGVLSSVGIPIEDNLFHMGLENLKMLLMMLLALADVEVVLVEDGPSLF